MKHAQIMSEFGPLPATAFCIEDLEGEELETVIRMLEDSIARWPEGKAEMDARELWAIGVQAGKEACRNRLGIPDPEAEWHQANPWFNAGELPPGYIPPDYD